MIHASDDGGGYASCKSDPGLRDDRDHWKESCSARSLKVTVCLCAWVSTDSGQPKLAGKVQSAWPMVVGGVAP